MFVKINKTIYDEKQYIKEVVWLKNDTKRKLVDLLDKDYILINIFERGFNHLKIQLYNKKLRINIYFEFSARKPLFV